MQLLYPLIFISLLGQCHHSPEVMYSKTQFKLENHGMTYKGALFTGRLVHFNKRTRKTTPYLNGVVNGTVEMTYNHNGRIAKTMPFRYGKKTGVHHGYYPSGARRFESHYRDDKYDGGATQWYESGQVYSYTLYASGKLIGHKLWRENGRIYSNYVYQNGRKLGLDGGKLCLNVKDTAKELP